MEQRKDVILYGDRITRIKGGWRYHGMDTYTHKTKDDGDGNTDFLRSRESWDRRTRGETRTFGLEFVTGYSAERALGETDQRRGRGLTKDQKHSGADTWMEGWKEQYIFYR